MFLLFSGRKAVISATISLEFNEIMIFETNLGYIAKTLKLIAIFLHNQDRFWTKYIVENSENLAFPSHFSSCGECER